MIPLTSHGLLTAHEVFQLINNTNCPRHYDSHIVRSDDSWIRQGVINTEAEGHRNSEETSISISRRLMRQEAIG